MPLFFVRFWLLLSACLLLSGGAFASESTPETLVQSRQWRMDKTGLDALQDAEKATDWQDLPEWNSWGFGPETIWVRLQLKAAEPDMRMPWVVRVRPSFLDYVTLHDPASGLVLRSGDAMPPEGDDLASIHFRFQIPPLPQTRTVYLQMRTTSGRTLHAQVLPYTQDLQHNRMQEWTMGFVMASSVIFAIWAFLQWCVSRDKVIGAFALKQLFSAGWAFFFLGFARVAIGPGLPEGLLTLVSSMVFVGVISVTLWFFSLLMAGYQPARWALRAIQALAVLVLTLPLLYRGEQTHLLAKMGNHSVLLGFALLLLALLTALPKRVKQPIPLGVFLVYLLVYSSLNSWPSLIHLAWVEAHPMVLFGGFAHAVLDGIVMFVLLQVRARRLRKDQMQNALDLQRSQQQAEAEKRHREEQSQLFAMLAHEMKTPLATLRIWMDMGQLKPEVMASTIADMNQVIERCVHTGQLADQGLQPDWQTVDPVEVTSACIQSCRSSALVDWRGSDAKGSLQTDAQMLSIVLGNLLDNACKYGAPDGRIQLSLNRTQENGQDGWLWLVSNQAGPGGLPDAERLFEKYYRSPQARRLSGSGLGLFLVKGLLELMRGRIGYETQADRAVFSLWLPQQPA